MDEDLLLPELFMLLLLEETALVFAMELIELTWLRLLEDEDLDEGTETGREDELTADDRPVDEDRFEDLLEKDNSEEVLEEIASIELV